MATPSCSAAAAVTILNDRAGRLGGGDGEAGEREHRAVARLDHRDAAELAAQRASGAVLLQPEPDRRVDRAARGGRRRARPRGRRSAATSCGGRRGGRRRCAPARSACRRRCPRSTRRWGRSSAAARRRRRCSRAAAPRRCAAHLLALLAARAGAAPATRRRARRRRRSASAWNFSVPFSVPKSLVLTVTGTLDVAAAEQRADRPERDLLDARGPVRAPVVGEERDLRVGLPARRVEQRVHRLVVALRPRLRRTSRRPARRSSASSWLLTSA